MRLDLRLSPKCSAVFLLEASSYESATICLVLVKCKTAPTAADYHTGTEKLNPLVPARINLLNSTFSQRPIHGIVGMNGLNF